MELEKSRLNDEINWFYHHIMNDLQNDKLNSTKKELGLKNSFYHKQNFQKELNNVSIQLDSISKRIDNLKILVSLFHSTIH